MEELCFDSHAPLRTIRAVTGKHSRFVGSKHIVCAAVESDCTVIYPNNTMAKPANLIHLVRYQDNGAACAGNIAHFAKALFLEVDVADGEDFIDEENFRL